MCENKTMLTNAVVGCIFPDENVNVTYVQDDIQTLSPTQIDTNDKERVFSF